MEKMEMVKKLALKKVKERLGIFEEKDMTDIDFGHIKKVLSVNSFYELVIDYKIKNIKHVSVVKVYETELDELTSMSITLDYLQEKNKRQ